MAQILSLSQNNAFYHSGLGVHLSEEVSTAITNKFENLEKLFTKGSSLSYNGETWNVRCDWITVPGHDSKLDIFGVFLRMHSSNQLGGYEYSCHRMINATIINTDSHNILPDHIVESSLLNVLKNGHLSEEEIPVVPQYFADSVSEFFQTAPQLIPPTDPTRLPPPEFTKTPIDVPVDKPITPKVTPVPPKLNSGRILSTLAVLGGAIYFISKYARTHFASLKEIFLNKSSFFATPQNRMLLLLPLLLSTAIVFSRTRRRTQY